MRSLTIALGCVLSAATFAQGSLKPGDPIPGEIVVKYHDGAAVSSFAMNLSLNARLLRVSAGTEAQTLKVPDVAAALRRLRSVPEVKFAEPNYVVSAAFDPNDPYRSSQWALSKINAPQAWELSQGTSTIKIAIIDTGVDLDHPDLASKIDGGFDFVNNDAVADDDHGHGTHCAGLAAAATNNGLGVAGVGFNSHIIPIKVLGANGSGSTSTIAAGIEYAVNAGAKVISLSLGGPSNSSAMNDAVNYAWSNGVIVVAAAGNSNTSAMFYPAASTNAIAVGATDQNDAKASFSNFGTWVDVAAPGVSLLSTYLNGQYLNMSGTSMATPVVAGLAALLWEDLGSATAPSVVRNKLESTCDPIAGGWVIFGRVNALRALQPVYTPPPAQEYGVSQMAFARGGVASGDASSLNTADNVRLVLNQTLVGRNRQVDGTFEFAPPVSHNPQRWNLYFEASQNPKGSVSLSIWSPSRNRWTSISNTTLYTIDKTFMWAIPNSSLYRSPNGTIKIRLYRSATAASSIAIDHFVLKPAP
jgi:thermitase